MRWAREHLGAGAFNGHDLLDQPEHGAGCPSRNILGGWVGEGGGPTNAGPGGAPCVECAKWLEPRHLSQFVERNQVLRQPALKWAFFNVRPTQPRVCAPRPVWPWPSFRGPSPNTRTHPGLPVSCLPNTPAAPLPSPAAAWPIGDPSPLPAMLQGNGYSSWESVWGGWNGVSPRDGETIRRIYTVLRQFEAATRSCNYVPFVPVARPALTRGCWTGLDTWMPKALTRGCHQKTADFGNMSRIPASRCELHAASSVVSSVILITIVRRARPSASGSGFDCR